MATGILPVTSTGVKRRHGRPHGGGLCHRRAPRDCEPGDGPGYDVAMPLVALYALRALLAVVLAGAGCGTTAQPPAPSTSDATPPVSAAAPAAPAWQTGDRWVF